MTLRDDDRGRGRDDRDEAVDVAPGVPTDRVRWGAILAGTFAALTALAVLGTLGVAIGLSTFDPGRDNPRNFALGYGVWGIISTILAFFFGGWLAARVAALHGKEVGLLNGLMVAAFGLPLLMFLLGSASTLMGQSDAATTRGDQARAGVNSDSAVTASGRMSPDNPSVAAPKTNTADDKQARREASRAAWVTLVTLALALGAASAGGYAGSRGKDDDGRTRRRRQMSTMDRPAADI